MGGFDEAEAMHQWERLEFEAPSMPFFTLQAHDLLSRLRRVCFRIGKDPFPFFSLPVLFFFPFSSLGFGLGFLVLVLGFWHLSSFFDIALRSQ